MENQTKIAARTKYLKKRDDLSSVDRTHASAVIRQRVFGRSEWLRAHTVLLYASFRSEVDTHKLIQEALTQKKRVVLPVVDRGKKEIGLSELQAFGDLAPGAFPGIYEPAMKLRKRVDPSEVEAVLVPGIAFDRQGGRIGMGVGYFDKLLFDMPNAKRIGLAFSVQISPKPLPLEAHDIRMHIILTEKEAILIP